MMKGPQQDVRKTKNRELTSSAAKEWFESNYAPVVTTRTSGGEGKRTGYKTILG